MFDIGFWELILISILGLVVLGPQRLPHAVRSVAKILAMAKGMVNHLQQELTQELAISEQQTAKSHQTQSDEEQSSVATQAESSPSSSPDQEAATDIVSSKVSSASESSNTTKLD